MPKGRRSSERSCDTSSLTDGPLGLAYVLLAHSDPYQSFVPHNRAKPVGAYQPRFGLWISQGTPSRRQFRHDPPRFSASQRIFRPRQLEHARPALCLTNSFLNVRFLFSPSGNKEYWENIVAKQLRIGELRPRSPSPTCGKDDTGKEYSCRESENSVKPSTPYHDIPTGINTTGPQSRREIVPQICRCLNMYHRERVGCEI